MSCAGARRAPLSPPNLTPPARFPWPRNGGESRTVLGFAEAGIGAGNCARAAFRRAFLLDDCSLLPRRSLWRRRRLVRMVLGLAEIWLCPLVVEAIMLARLLAPSVKATLKAGMVPSFSGEFCEGVKAGLPPWLRRAPVWCPVAFCPVGSWRRSIAPRGRPRGLPRRVPDDQSPVVSPRRQRTAHRRGAGGGSFGLPGASLGRLSSRPRWREVPGPLPPSAALIRRSRPESGDPFTA